ncbi:Uncharacterised protein [Candidatus Burarchaeum australiense]|nr:Uncharacterised protein [Candidatus Burarchaeum australiense]
MAVTNAWLLRPSMIYGADVAPGKQLPQNSQAVSKIPFCCGSCRIPNLFLDQQVEAVIKLLKAQEYKELPHDCKEQIVALLVNPDLPLRDFNRLFRAVDVHPAELSDKLFQTAIAYLSKAAKTAENAGDS